MLSWVRRQRHKIERIEAEADALIQNLGLGAYSAARRREHDASSEPVARHWRRVALAIARKTGRRVGLDTSTRMATEADLTAKGDPIVILHMPPSDLDPLDELMRLVPEAMTRSISAPKRLRHWRRHAEEQRNRMKH
jgi:ribosomal protein L39E